VAAAISIPLDGVSLEADLQIPDGARGLVAFAHGSGSGRYSPRNRWVAERLRTALLGSLLVDLLTEVEEQVDAVTRELRFDIGLLTDRLVGITDWAVGDAATRHLPIGYFGASTGAAAALIAAARRPEVVRAVVSRGGRPDLAGDALPAVQAPTLLIVGGADQPVIRLNEQAAAVLHAPHRLEIVPGATHLFEEPGALGRVAELAAEWFTAHLAETSWPRSVSSRTQSR
jgi:putative phosphoribosyl transferase